MMMAMRASIACIQETEIQDFDEQLVAQTLGLQFSSNFSYLPASGTSGGILIATSGGHFRLLVSESHSFYLNGQNPDAQ
jgi:hypothetical protein